MSKTAIKYGLISGGVMILAFMAYFYIFMGGEVNDKLMSEGELVGYSSMILSMLVVFFGIKTFRDKYNGGKMTYLQGLGIGSYISLIAGIMFGIYSFLLYAYITPDFADKYFTYQENYIKKSDLPENEKQEKLQEMQNIPAWEKSPAFGGVIMLVTVFSIGFIITLVAAAIFKRNDLPGNKQTVLAN